MKNKNNFGILFFVVLIVGLMYILPTEVSAADIYVDNNANLIVSLVNQNPNPAQAGDVATIYLGIENIGGVQAKNVVFELLPSYPFSLASGEDAVENVGSIATYQGADGDSIKIINYKVKVDKDASSGRYKLNFKYYDDSADMFVEKSVYVEVDATQSAEIVKIDKTVLVPGEESTIKFTINNVGNAPLKNVVFYWENDEDIVLPVGSDNTKYVSYIDVGASKEIEYKVIADTNADAGLYKLNLHLTYEDSSNGEEKNTNTIAGVYVGGGTDFDVVFSENSGGQISFSIANTGSNPASSVSVIVPEQKGWTVSDSNSVIIGNLNQGDYTIASFSIQNSRAGAFSGNITQQQQMPVQKIPVQNIQNQTSEGTIKIQVAYTDTMGQRKFIDKDVKMPSSTSTSVTSSFPASAAGGYAGFSNRNQSFFQKYKWHLIILIIIVVIIYLYIFQKKKNSKILAKSQDEKETKKRIFSNK